MGRRSLRKIDPSLDLSLHLLSVESLPQPWDAGALFNRPAPLEVEVGSGKGLFMLRAAQQFPEHNFLGIEIAHKYARFAAARLAKHEIANAAMVQGDAQRVFREVLPDESLAAVHVYFPDPWWKKRHHKRRIMNDAFLGQVQRVLLPDGRLHFWTDVGDYFEESLARIAVVTSLAGPFPVDAAPAEHTLDYRTHFERRMRLANLPVYRSEFRKELTGPNGHA
ncbi:MAG: tRNA (guanosine(46)-N7)-methyltransferase TrmB [Pirellulales bacterium]